MCLSQNPLIERSMRRRRDDLSVGSQKGCCSRLLCHKTHDSRKPHKCSSLFTDLCHKLDLSSLFRQPSNSQFNGVFFILLPPPPLLLQKETIPTDDSRVLVNNLLSQQGCVGKRYEVFLSCQCSNGTREGNFLSDLYSSLKEAGISVLKDDISSELLHSPTEGSEISIIVFSKQYLRNESTFIQNIIERVRQILDGKDSKDGLVGWKSQVQEVIKMLQKHQSKNALWIGIWGMGGVGKTTIARLIFEHIQYEFERACFLSNVREAWETGGPYGLIRELVLAMRDRTDLMVDEVDEKQSLGRASDHKVLLVVDDVNDVQQLRSLCGNVHGQGSIIIITTRDSHIFQAFHRVDYVYSVKHLSDHESLELLSRTAFNQASLEAEFIELGRRLVAYTEGLPLALKVVGSIMNGRSPIEWESALIKLSTDLPRDIYNTLELSFYSLDDDEKEIFLNIVLFYIGEDRDAVIQKLDGRGFSASIGIRALVNRSLVTIDHNNKLRVHNLLQLMGRQITRETSQNVILNKGHRYEVFLSFRGDDTRATFTSHLYTALCNAGITVFKDDVELPRGNRIDRELLQAIGSSKIAIIVFSREYAASKWCLEELSIIMELHKSNCQVVLPVFYDVDPSEIRNQTSSFGKAFKDLINRISPLEHQVSKWRTALVEAGGIAGIVVLGSRDESENVKTIIENVCDILDKKDLFVAEHPVGVDNRMQEVIKMLQNHPSEDVIMIGIWGMGGTGKTTIAKAIYNEIGCTFESRSYLSKIREVWNQGKKNQVNLQNQLLSEICMTTKIKINSIESGIITLRDRLHHKKVLVVLDDVDELVQLNALVGSRAWFKPGSIIIITTRNQRLLLQVNCGVYLMKNLDDSESIELFSWHAFKQESPKKDFIKLSRDIVAYSGGLPLALEVIGSYLFDRDVEEWKIVLEKLKKIPNDKIQKKLKISFDGLSDDLEKEIFLDISCFFIGMDKNEVTQILNGCELFADIGIKTLIERSLVSIDEKNKLVMHDLLRDMGREIIRKQSQKELGRRSRLWFQEDTLAVLFEHMGTEAIEGLSLTLSQSEKMHFQTEAFRMINKLRLLHLENVQLRGGYKYISRNLRWLCWHGFPTKYIPSNFYQQNLVAIDLKYSNLTQVWKEPQLLKTLKILNLSHSHYLVQTPDFSKLPNLEKLILKDCPSLFMIHHSIGLLHRLLLLDLEDCIGLHSLPRSIYRLKCLRTLILSGCKNIEKLEEDIEQMESLTTLIAPAIKQVPFSIVRLKSVLYLSICGHEGLSHHVIPSLYQSWMSPTKNPLPLIPTHVGMPSSILLNMLNTKSFVGRWIGDS
ncbi:TMV resistance protein N-like [Neltuma alba]|uniref:TMV resistance protein N-like n=1 Tax=Neltuma alba TaxID=207710 RepID=UPI0010A43000|nr:TMV resistance protein N-like [Prosopis alba]